MAHEREARFKITGTKQRAQHLRERLTNKHN